MHAIRTLARLTLEALATSPKRAGASIVLIGLLSLMEGVGLLLLMPLLMLVGIDEPTTMPTVLEALDAAFAWIGIEPTLGSVLLLFVSLAGTRAGLTRAHTWVNSSLREDVTARLRLRLYRAVSRAEWKFLVTRRPSEFVHVLASEVGQAGGAGFQVVNLLVAAAVTIVYVAMAFRFSAALALLVLGCAALLAWPARGRLEQAREWGWQASQSRRELHGLIAEHMASLKTAKSYGVMERQLGLFVKLSDDLKRVNLQMTAGNADLQQSLEFSSTVVLAVITYIALEVLDVAPAQLLVLLFIFARLMPRLIGIYRQVQSLSGVMPVLDSVALIERECAEAAEAQTLDEGASAPLRLAQGIRFQGVTFTYLRRAERPAIADLDLEIKTGCTTAIVGSSGAGKSTLADLLIGLLSPTHGQILVDGSPLTIDRLAAWRRQISYVPQETFLFHDTVRANLTWARPDASDDQLWRALRLSAADKFVSNLPQSLDTVVGERGVLISGGERQRLSLARALLRDPQVLVLDEATSSLDSENEQRIQQAVAALHHQMTIVIITHRLSTIRDADVIHVLDEGRLVESGSWGELLSKPAGRFRELCAAQGIHAPAHPLAGTAPIGAR